MIQNTNTSESRQIHLLLFFFKSRLRIQILTAFFSK